MTEKQVFLAIRNGTLGTKVNEFHIDDFSPFLPFLIDHFIDISDSDSQLLTKEQLNAIRARIIGCPDGNEVIQISKLNFETLETRFKDVYTGTSLNINGPYASLSLEKKVLFIGSYLINKVKEENNATDSFDPFDVETYQKEVIWIISTLCTHIPQYFNIVKLSSIFICYVFGGPILHGIVLNHPVFLDQVLDTILSLDTTNADNSFVRRRREIINMILALDPNQIDRFIKSSIENQERLRICVEILCDSNLVDDQMFVNTLISNLLNSDGTFCQFLIKNANKVFMNMIRTRYNEILQTQMSSEFKQRVVLLLAVLSHYNFLRAVSNDVTHQWIRFLTDQTSSDNLQLVKVVLAVILACPNLMPSNQQAFRDDFVEEKLKEFFRWIKERSEIGDPNEFASLNRFMLLISIHMQKNNGEELSKLLSDELSFNVGDTLRKHTTVKVLFLRYAMPENVVAQKAIILGVTKNLDANFAGYLPAHCVNHLIMARTFSRNQIVVQDWIKRQIRECTVPIHPIMVQVLENFAITCFPTADDQNFNEQIEEDFFWEIFSTDLFSDDKTLAQKVLCLFYLLAFTRRFDTNPSINSFTSKKAPKAYSDKLWAEIPIRYILSVTDARPSEFNVIRMNLLNYIGIIMPHMLPTLDASIDRTEDELALKEMPTFQRVPKELFKQALEEIGSNLNQFTLLVQHLQDAPIQEQYVHYETIINAMLITLDHSICPQSVTLKLAQIWRRLSNLIPRKLYEQTLQLWLNTPNSATQGPIEIDNSVLLKETPSMLFRVDSRIFRSPPHFEMLMQILTFYLDAIKNYNNVRLLKVIAAQENKVDVDEKNMLMKSYAGAQHLAVVQLLLEICNGDKETEQNLEEICNIACAQIHQMFVSDPALPKLVHFLMYPVHLIPMVVDKVPSMHVLITGIADLIMPAHLERRIFAINLVAELALKYTVALALSAVEFVEDVLGTILENTIDEDTIVLFLNITDALKKFISFGSPHKEFVEAMLNRVRNIANARCALYRSECAVFSSPERHLISKIDAILLQ